MNISSIKTSLAESEQLSTVRDNPRLQWMLLFILVLLFVYIVKISFDGLQSGQTELEQQAKLVARLQSTLEAEIDEQAIDDWQAIYSETLNAIPKAASQSLAEASALAQLENTLTPLLVRSRLNLLGSEAHQLTRERVYKVRVELSGRLPTDKVSDFLQELAQNRSHIILQTMNYSPRTSNTLSMVVDVLFIDPSDNAISELETP